MRQRLSMAAVLVLCGASAHADKISKEFRVEFERTFRPKSTYAVVVQSGIPTVSVYGTDPCKRDQFPNHHFSVDIVDGKWSISQGLLDVDQKMMDTLKAGEIMELNRISYHDNRIEMRFVSLEAHKFTCGFWKLKTDSRDPVGTYFKFFLPFDKSRSVGPDDITEVMRSIEPMLRVFPNESAARAYSARMLSRRPGEDARPAPRPVAEPASAPRSSEKREIKVGMTPLLVIDILGKPQKEVTFENTTKWTYPDLTVIFESGRVKEVRF